MTGSRPRSALRRMVRPILLSAASSALLLGCGATEEELRARVAFDFKCDATDIRFTRIDDRTVGVRACGERATYIESCQAGPPGSGRCTWVMNSERSRKRGDSDD